MMSGLAVRQCVVLLKTFLVAAVWFAGIKRLSVKTPRSDGIQRWLSRSRGRSGRTKKLPHHKEDIAEATELLLTT
jgi:hypothetical protein